MNRNESSQKELTWAIKIAQLSPKSDKKAQAIFLFDTTLTILKKKRIREDMEIVDNHNIHKVVSTENSEITSNLISQIAYEIEKLRSDIKSSGSYFTPYVLANDMVRMAASDWLNKNGVKNLKKTTEHIFSSDNAYLKKLQKVTWYDPCVGGGVFPLAIAQLLEKAGLSPKEIINNIHGSELNPLFVEATKIRLALFLSKGNKEIFLDLYEELNNKFHCGDSLVFYAEENTIFAVNKSKVDIVIGNPPYVRSNDINKQQKSLLKDLYPSVWSGISDLYMFFIAHGINALKDKGVLCYISPATFQRASSGLQIRNYIQKNSGIDIVFDFDELPIFDKVSSHLSVYILSKGPQAAKALYFLYKQLPSELPLLTGFKESSTVEVSKKSEHLWNLSAEDNIIFPLIEKDSIPLGKYAKGIYSGIKTGLKNAYEINKEEHTEILNDERSKPYIFPMLKPCQIEKWFLNWNQTFHIVIKRGQKLDPRSKVYEHLLKYQDLLEKRTDLKKRSEWYALRDCTYYELFTQPKIVYRDISTNCRFTMDNTGLLVIDGGFFIPQEDYFLLGLLNSKLGLFYFKSRCATIGSAKAQGRLRFKKTYVSGFPVRLSSQKVMKAIENVAKKITSGGANTEKLESELNNLVFNLYEIPKNQRRILLNS